MFHRLVQPLQGPPARRAYSFFSSKSGNGRFFNSARLGKPLTKPATAIVAPPSTINASDASIAPEDSSPSSPASPMTELESPSSLLSLSHASPPEHHPQPNAATFHLHNFFSLDRPLLLLNQPSAALFEHLQPTPQAREPASNFLADMEEMHEDPEADVNAARLLARSVVMQKVESTVEWDAVMAQLGLASGEIAAVEQVAEMDSTKRKRKKKMTKHRYKKRRKLQRAERRRLGK